MVEGGPECSEFHAVLFCTRTFGSVACSVQSPVVCNNNFLHVHLVRLGNATQMAVRFYSNHLNLNLNHMLKLHAHKHTHTHGAAGEEEDSDDMGRDSDSDHHGARVQVCVCARARAGGEGGKHNYKITTVNVCVVLLISIP